LRQDCITGLRSLRSLRSYAVKLLSAAALLQTCVGYNSFLSISYAIAECFGTGFPNSQFPPVAANSTRHIATKVRSSPKKPQEVELICSFSGQQSLGFQFFFACACGQFKL
jgi:hypothetical protein